MKIYDTLMKRKVDFVPVNEGEAKIYLCGPTVYDYGHLGHGRSAVAFDLLRRYLIYRDYRVVFVRNWTDIDDKTIERARKEKTTVKELTERFIQIYREDYGKLNVLEPDFDPKPTEHIPEIIDIIKRLVDRGHAYILEDGVYFDISTFPDYGRLSGQNLDELIEGARVEVTKGKRNPGDFVLWKFEKPGEPSWESPWGRGRPGWHIECTAMSVKYLGEEFDIHCGGQDLTFPHHEDEIAQARGAGFAFARYWMHNGFLKIENEKMSKSLGNFFTLREIFKKYSPAVVRFFLLSTHYRAPLNFSFEALDQAENALQRYNDFIVRIMDVRESAGVSSIAEDSNPVKFKELEIIGKLVASTKKGFCEAMDDDLNISRALAEISEFVRKVNIMIDRNEIGPGEAEMVYGFMKEINSVLGVFTLERELLPEEIEELIRKRAEARKVRNFAEADRIRDELMKMGIILEDTKEGTRWKRKI